MSYEFYKVMHLSGLIMLVSGLAALWGTYFTGGPPSKGSRIGLALVHGFGMLFLLISGFAMLGKLGLMAALPTWSYVKFAVWLFLGVSMVLAKRKASWGLSLILLWVLAGTYAAYLGVFKP